MPIPINDLITSAAFTDILCAKSATVMVSGTIISFIKGSVGATNVVSASLVCLVWLYFLCLLFGGLHPSGTGFEFLVLITFFLGLSSQSDLVSFLISLFSGL